jgi:hypothetical protein
MAHLESVVERFDAPPILMGHSAGGALCSYSSIMAMGRLEWRSTLHLRKVCASRRCHSSNRRSRC